MRLVIEKEAEYVTWSVLYFSGEYYSYFENCGSLGALPNVIWQPPFALSRAEAAAEILRLGGDPDELMRSAEEHKLAERTSPKKECK